MTLPASTTATRLHILRITCISCVMRIIVSPNFLFISKSKSELHLLYLDPMPKLPHHIGEPYGYLPMPLLSRHVVSVHPKAEKDTHVHGHLTLLDQSVLEHVFFVHFLAS